MSLASVVMRNAFILLASSGLVACGGRTSLNTANELDAARSVDAYVSERTDAAIDAPIESGPEAGDDADGPSVLCPSTPHGDGDPCSVGGFVCEYGDNANPYCNVYEICYGQLAGWSNLGVPAFVCGQGTCPATYADVDQGGACAVRNLDCAYPEGQCNCGAGSTIDPIPTGPRVLTCNTPSDCPEPRPRLGTTCAHDGLICDYGNCNGGVAQRCIAALGWVRVPPSCSDAGQ